MTAPDAREQPATTTRATTTRATSTTFVVGQRVVANRDITNDMIVTGDDTIIVPKGAAGVVDGLSNKLMRQYDFDLEVRFDQYMALYVNSDWLTLVEQDEVVSSREAVEHAVVERIISELTRRANNPGVIDDNPEWWRGYHQAEKDLLHIVTNIIKADTSPSLDALVGTEPEHGLRLDTLHRPSGGDKS